MRILSWARRALESLRGARRGRRAPRRRRTNADRNARASGRGRGGRRTHRASREGFDDPAFAWRPRLRSCRRARGLGLAVQGLDDRGDREMLHAVRAGQTAAREGGAVKIRRVGDVELFEIIEARVDEDEQGLRPDDAREALDGEVGRHGVCVERLGAHVGGGQRIRDDEGVGDGVPRHQDIVRAARQAQAEIALDLGDGIQGPERGPRRILELPVKRAVVAEKSLKSAARAKARSSWRKRCISSASPACSRSGCLRSGLSAPARRVRIVDQGRHRGFLAGVDRGEVPVQRDGWMLSEGAETLDPLPVLGGVGVRGSRPTVAARRRAAEAMDPRRDRRRPEPWRRRGGGANASIAIVAVRRNAKCIGAEHSLKSEVSQDACAHLAPCSSVTLRRWKRIRGCKSRRAGRDHRACLPCHSVRWSRTARTRSGVGWPAGSIRNRLRALTWRPRRCALLRLPSG